MNNRFVQKVFTDKVYVSEQGLQYPQAELSEIYSPAGPTRIEHHALMSYQFLTQDVSDFPLYIIGNIQGVPLSVHMSASENKKT